MKKISPKKLLNSKWTAVAPQNKEKHFVITQVEFDEEGLVVLCVIQAVMNKREQEINWRDLNDMEQWRVGWV